jgi:hypothetical protein
MGLFQLGGIVATPGALDALGRDQERIADLISRHAIGDWGDLSVHDRKANNDALKDGELLLSAYSIGLGVKIWIITERDRSVTTILLPREY